jgi:hypothetical protein
MTAKLPPALRVVAAALLVVSTAAEAFALGSVSSREKRALLRCTRAISDAGLSYAQQVNSRVSECLGQLNACTRVERRSLESCLSTARACGQASVVLRAWESRLQARIVAQCQGVAVDDVLDDLGFGADMEECAPNSLESFATCLGRRLRATTMPTLAHLHPGACELAAAAGLGDTVPLDACQGGSDSSDDPPESQELRYCGGPEGVPCPPGQVCNRTDPLCSFASVAGVCTAAPTACVDAGEPVCGCGGTTYASDCHRIAVEAVLRHPGACAGPPGSCTFADPLCPVGQFCDFPAGDCGEGQPGECRPMSAEPCNLCAEFMGGEVCGCDRMTYPSECDRRAAGVPKWFDGPCF